MAMDHTRANELSGGVFLLGLGILFFTGFWWPGIMFVIGATAVVQGFARGQGWYALQSGIWTVAIGIWALFHFNIAILLAALGLSMVISAFIRPPMFEKKPVVDNTLE